VIEVYRKRGRVVRREGAHLVWVDEAGEAVEEGSTFRARVLDEPVDLPRPDAEAVKAAAQEIEALIRPPLAIERLIVSEGITEHEISGHRWTESARRIHLSIAKPPLRALIDRSDFTLDAIAGAARALSRAGGERTAPRRLRIAEHVGAALLPSLDVPMLQTAAARDGKGLPIEERRVTAEGPPNWFRPSYRLRPRRAWFHLRVQAAGEIDETLPVAIALLAPIEGRSVRLLCSDGDDVYSAVIEARRVLAARATSIWYPYSAGSFGAEMML
jgi:hypothetical protein